MRYILALLFVLGSMGASAQETTFKVGTKYTAQVSACLEKEAMDAMIEADKNGYEAEMWQLLSSIGKCGNIVVELTITKLIETYHATRGVDISVAEAEVVGDDGAKVTIYIATRRHIVEVKA